MVTALAHESTLSFSFSPRCSPFETVVALVIADRCCNHVGFINNFRVLLEVFLVASTTKTMTMTMRTTTTQQQSSTTRATNVLQFSSD